MDPFLDLVERSNQRSERMFSVIDLMEAGTLTPALAAWLVEYVRAGGSWLVGARPGAAGKTTIMSALLAMTPPLAPGRALRLTVPGTGWEGCGAGDCVVAYEISPGPYDAYIWAGRVARFAALARAGVRAVSNLHADTLDEARHQIVAQCGATPADFDAIGLFVPIVLSHDGPGGHNVTRRVPKVLWHDGQAWLAFTEHDAVRALAAPGNGPHHAGTGEAATVRERLRATLAFLEGCRDKNVRLVERVREAWLGYLAAEGA